MSEIVTINGQEVQGQERRGQGLIGPANSEAISLVAAVAENEAGAIGGTSKPRTLEDVFRRIAAQEAGLHRDQFPGSQIRVEPGRLIAGDKEFQLDNEGVRRLCKMFQAPAEYLASLNAGLQARVLQEHFAERRFMRSKIKDETACIVSRSGTFVDIGRRDLFTLDNAAVLQAAREGVGNHASIIEVQNLQLDDECFVLDMVSPQLAEEVRPGDILRGGVHVAHSQLTGEATKVMAYVLRLVCANGLVQRKCLGEEHGSTPRTRRLSAARPKAREMQMAQIRKLVADTWSGLQEKLGAIRRLQSKEVREIRAALERFLRQAHLFSRGLMNQLMLAWEKEGSELTVLGALNALTRVATHSPELPPWQRQRLSRLAGIYANQDVHMCPHCFSVLAG